MGGHKAKVNLDTSKISKYGPVKEILMIQAIMLSHCNQTGYTIFNDFGRQSFLIQVRKERQNVKLFENGACELYW